MEKAHLFHIGPQKSGTTWVFNCLKQHPEILTSEKDSIHYFDINYHRGRGWYYKHFLGDGFKRKIFDPTYTYLRSPLAPKRIRAENPNALISLTMRHPVSRAFSHYWHEKKKKRHNFRFEEVIYNYDLFSSWVEPGFYAAHLERYLECFPYSQILPQLYDDLSSCPENFLKDLFQFYGIRTDFKPSVVNQRLNVASPEQNFRTKFINKLLISGYSALTLSNPSQNYPAKSECKKLKGQKNAWLFGAGNIEYLSEQPQPLIEDLMAVCEPEIEHLENLLSLDLSSWRTMRSIGC